MSLNVHNKFFDSVIQNIPICDEVFVVVTFFDMFILILLYSLNSSTLTKMDSFRNILNVNLSHKDYICTYFTIYDTIAYPCNTTYPHYFNR